MFLLNQPCLTPRYGFRRGELQEYVYFLLAGCQLFCIKSLEIFIEKLKNACHRYKFILLFDPFVVFVCFFVDKHAVGHVVELLVFKEPPTAKWACLGRSSVGQQ